jgi:hypothetical protein
MSDSIHLYQKLSLNPLAGFIIPIASISRHGIDLINEDDAGLLLSGHLKEILDYFFALSDILAHDITAGYAEEGGL